MGIEPTGRALSDLLPEWMREIRKKTGDKPDEVFSLFQNLMGPMAAKTEPEKFIDGVLTVKVKSATLYSLLVQHERPRLLRELAKECPSVKKLVFRVGS